MLTLRCFLLVIITVTGAKSVVRQDIPKNGWYFSYEAASGFMPGEFKRRGRKTLEILGYQADSPEKPAFSCMSFEKDLNQCVLRMNNDGGEETNNRLQGNFAHFRYLLPDDFLYDRKDPIVTVEARFRLLDEVETSAQFSIAGVLPVSGNGKEELVKMWAAFGRDNISCMHDGKLLNGKRNLGNGWHTAKISINLQERTYRLFLDNESSTVFSGKLSAVNSGSPSFQFGDGSANIKGAAALAYFRICLSPKPRRY